MESQGASFAFDASMDFSAAFATPQQHSMKPAEGETSGFFCDEAIDTATFIDPTVFNTPQEQTYMPQNLAMDSTSGSTSLWNTQLTPQQPHALSTFPPTPVHSFDSIYQQGLSTSLGKRSLEIGDFDFPQPKRHESVFMGDFPLFPSMPSTASATSNWGLDTQLTPPVSTTEFGLSDDAADVCATWFHKFNVLPSDRHIESLSQLTGESADAVRSWFGRLLKQGMGSTQGDSAYKSQTSLTQHEPLWNGSYSTDTLQASPSQLFVPQAESSTTPEVTTTTVQPATALRGSKKRCTPTDDPQLLGRDPSKIYQCTRKCGKRYGRKCDWKRNEEEGYPCKSWVCSLCVSEGVENVKPCFRKYHFVQHFRNIHPDINADDHEETSIVSSETEFPRNCGFCRHRFVSRQDRIDHIADHFKAGKSMLDWRDEDSHDSHNDDDNDDDDDDGSNGDGFDGAPSFPPPPFDPRGAPGSKHHRGNGSSGGSSEHLHTQGGYFQFQLSQLDQGRNRAESPIIEGLTQKKLSVQISQDQLGAALDTLARDCSMHGKQTTTPGGGQDAVAGDVLSQSMSPLPSVGHALSTEPALGLTEHHFECRDQGHEGLHIAAGAGADNKAGHDGGSDSQEETSESLPSNISARPRSSVSHFGFPLDILRLSSSSPPLSSASSHQIPQGVPPASKPFLSVKLLGAGGFSTVDEVVHRGTHLRLGRKTLKNRDESAIEELRKEISVLQKLRHPHVIRFLAAYSSGDKMSILLSPVAETTLALWLERTLLQKPTNMTETIVSMFGCLASSVRYIHEQRPVIKHMDIKPQNILIVNSDSELPQVVLCDFGISSSEDVSEEHVVPITRQYTAPEVFEGSIRKEAADIWSLGCVFAEMASVSFSQGNSGWLDFRKAFSGRTGKYYWQDVPGVQARLTSFIEEAASTTEQTVAGTVKAMLSLEPSERPSAASLTMIFTPAPCCLNWPNEKAIFPGPREELEWVKDLDREEHVDCQAQTHACEAIEEASRIEVFAAANWLEECSYSHEACQHVSSSYSTALPKRLVDLLPNDQNEPYIRLVDSLDIEPSDNPVEYMALSHVWTDTQPLLLSSTMPDLRNGLPLEELPDDLNMAIATTRRLGYRYIWADSLCVVQDSTADKEQECKAMASVFRNAALTIVMDQLATPKLGTETLGQDMTDPQKDSLTTNARPPRVDRTEHQQPPSASLPAMDFTTPGFAWDTRAWVLQERLLSRRFLHVGKQLYWECNTLKASETFPRGLSPLVWEKVHSKRSPSLPMPRIEHRSSKSSFSCGTCTSETRPDVPATSRLRDCQFIRKEGDGVSDGKEAAQTMLQLGAVVQAQSRSRSHALGQARKQPSAARHTAAADTSQPALDCGFCSPKPSCSAAFDHKSHSTHHHARRTANASTATEYSPTLCQMSHSRNDHLEHRHRHKHEGIPCPAPPPHLLPHRHHTPANPGQHPREDTYHQRSRPSTHPLQ